jgi:competence protein ComEC
VKYILKYPPVVSVIPFALGILSSKLPGQELPFIGYYMEYIPFVISAVAIIVIFIYNRIADSVWYLSVYICLIFLSGVLLFQYVYYKKSVTNVGNFISDDAVIYGRISEMPELKDDRIRLLLDADSVNGNIADGYVLVTVYKASYRDQTADSYFYGDYISVKGKLKKLPHKRNPGEFDYGHYLKLHDIDAVFTAWGYDKINFIGKTDQGFYYGKFIYPFKRYSVKVIDKLVGGEEGEYLKGLVLGERSNISRETKENFINAGVAHIIAVSGLNVAYVIIIIWGFLTFVPVRYSLKIFITITLLIMYMNLTGNVPSITRATIMASMFLISGVFERKPNAYNILAFSALVILLYDPRQLFDAGFILSYSAVLSIIIIYPVLESKLQSLKWYGNLDMTTAKGRFIKAVTALILGTFSAQIGMLPVSAIMFNKISVVSLFANLFAIPMANISLAIGFLIILSSFVSMWLASVFSAVNQMLLSIQLIFIEYCANLDWSYVETYFVDGFMLAVYYVILALALTINKLNYRFNFLCIFMILINFYVWYKIADSLQDCLITYLDSGNSTATLIKMPGGTSVLVNPGGSKDKYSSAERNIIPYLKLNGISEIDLLVINKMNKDEFRNLLKLTEKFDIKKIILPVYYKKLITSPYFADKLSKPEFYFINSSGIINRHGNFRIYIYYDSLLSASSMLTELVYGDQRFLFDDSDEPYVQAYNRLILPKEKIQFYKASGSGSFNITSPEFIGSLNTDYVVVSSSVSARKKIKTEVFTKALELIGMNIFEIAETGAIIVRTSGNESRIIQWR